MADDRIRPFRIEVPQADVDDLVDRLRRTRFPAPLPATTGTPEWPWPTSAS